MTQLLDNLPVDHQSGSEDTNGSLICSICGSVQAARKMYGTECWNCANGIK